MKKTIDEKLNEALGINDELVKAEEEIHEIIEVENIDTNVIEYDASADKKDEDFNTARDNIARLIQRGEEAVDGILRLASESEQPRAYEVASTLIKNMVEANKDLLDLHKQKKELEKEEYAGPKTQVQNNTMFVGSTKELQKHLLEMAKKEKGEEDNE